MVFDESGKRFMNMFHKDDSIKTFFLFICVLLSKLKLRSEVSVVSQTKRFLLSLIRFLLSLKQKRRYVINVKSTPVLKKRLSRHEINIFLMFSKKNIFLVELIL